MVITTVGNDADGRADGDLVTSHAASPQIERPGIQAGGSIESAF